MASILRTEQNNDKIYTWSYQKFMWMLRRHLQNYEMVPNAMQTRCSFPPGEARGRPITLIIFLKEWLYGFCRYAAIWIHEHWVYAYTLSDWKKLPNLTYMPICCHMNSWTLSVCLYLERQKKVAKERTHPITRFPRSMRHSGRNASTVLSPRRRYAI